MSITPNELAALMIAPDAIGSGAIIWQGSSDPKAYRLVTYSGENCSPRTVLQGRFDEVAYDGRGRAVEQRSEWRDLETVVLPC